jgi:hypothetical protein
MAAHRGRSTWTLDAPGAMMFTWLNKQGVRSSLGFEVQFIDRYTVRYREGARYLDVSVEDGVSAGKPCVCVSSYDAFERFTNSSLNNSPEEQERMKKNFRDALEFQGLSVD